MAKVQGGSGYTYHTDEHCGYGDTGCRLSISYTQYPQMVFINSDPQMTITSDFQNYRDTNIGMEWYCSIYG